MVDRIAEPARAAALSRLRGSARGRAGGGRRRRGGERRGADRGGGRARGARRSGGPRPCARPTRGCGIEAAVHAARVDARGARVVGALSATLVCAACGARSAPGSFAADGSARAAGCSRSCSSPEPRGRALRAPVRPAPARATRRVAGQRRVALPRAAAARAAARSSRTPRATRALYRRDALSRYAGRRRPGAQARGREPDRLVQGPRHDGRGHAAPCARARRPWPAPRPATRRPPWPPTPRRPACRALVFVPRGQGGGREAGAGAGLRRAHAARARATSTPACGWCARPPTTLGITLLNSVNPWRIEGQKTIVLELLQQRGWDPPDWIVVPAGNLGNTAAFGKALREARELGPDPPRAAASPPSRPRGASPFYRSFRGGFRHALPREARRRSPPRSASAIPPATTARVRAIRETRGVVAAVSDAADPGGQGGVDAAGIGCEPASAAAVAGVRAARSRGVIRRARLGGGGAHRPRAEGPAGGDALPLRERPRTRTGRSRSKAGWRRWPGC